MKNNLLLLTFASLAYGVQAQSNCWDNGDGSDGAFHADDDTTLIAGIYNYTSFIIDPDVTVSVSGSSILEIHCTENVTIDGTLSVNGPDGSDGVTFASAGIGGIGVAGGGNGGDGYFDAGNPGTPGSDGSYTGAGTGGDSWSGGGGGGYESTGQSSGMASGGFGGASYGSVDLLGLYPGSGGGGGSGGNNCGSGGGGAGGGFIVLNADSIFISATGSITSNGGNGGSDGTGSCGGGGAGSGGGLWIAGNHFSHFGSISAIGGTGGMSTNVGAPYFGVGGNGANGRIRIDFNNSNLIGTINPSNGYMTTVPYFSQSFTVCYGESINVGGNSYNTTGNYEDIFTAASGCDSIVQTNLTVKTQIDVGTSFGSGELSADFAGATSYQWIDCDDNNSHIVGENGQNFDPITNGNYAVIIEYDGCSDTSDCFLYDDTGLNENLQLKLSVYPNPSDGNVIISFDGNVNPFVINIYNTQGQLVHMTDANSSKIEMDLSHLKRGMYYVNLTNESINQQVKLTIK